MAKAVGPLFSMGARGSINKSITYTNHNGINVVKKIPTHPDANTLKQWFHRWRYRDACYAWRDLTSGEKAVYEALAEGTNTTGFNQFISAYLQEPTDLIASYYYQVPGLSEVPDMTGNGHDLTISGATCIDGLLEKCVHLDGVNDFMYSGASAALFSSEGTVLLVVVPWASIDQRTLWEIGVDSSHYLRLEKFVVPDKLGFRIDDGDGSTNASSAHSVQIDEVMMVVCSWDDTKQYISVNGSSSKVEAVHGGLPSAGTPMLFNGYSYYAASRYPSCNVGLLYYYNRVISDEQMNDQYAQLLLWLGCHG